MKLIHAQDRPGGRGCDCSRDPRFEELHDSEIACAVADAFREQTPAQRLDLRVNQPGLATALERLEAATYGSAARKINK